MFYELRKLLSHRIIIVLFLVFLFINGAYLMHSEKDVKIPSVYVNSLWNEIKDRSDTEKLSYINEKLETQDYVSSTDGTIDYARYILLDKWREQLESILGYPEFLSDIFESESRYNNGIFHIDDDSFYFKSIQNMTKAYKAMEGVQPVFGISEGVQKMQNNSISDVLCIVLALFISLYIFIGDRMIGIFGLLRSTKFGRTALCLSKLSALYALSFVIVISFTIENALISNYFYSFGELSRYIQSVDGFIGCCIPINLWEYLIIFTLLKFVAIVLISTVFSALCSLSGSNIMLILSSGAFFGTEYLLYGVLDNTILSRLNVFAFVHSDNILKEYKDIDIFDYPFSYTAVGSITILVTLIVCLGIMMYVFERSNTAFSVLKPNLKLPRKLTEHQFSRFGYTVYTSLVTQKTIVVLLCLIASAFVFGTVYQKEYNEYDTYYKYYSTKLQGNISTETLEFFKSENERFSITEKELERLLSSDTKYKILLYSLINLMFLPLNIFNFKLFSLYFLYKASLSISYL